MKSLLIFSLLFLALAAPAATSRGDDQSMKWKLDAFDEANGYWREWNTKRAQFIINKEPKVQQYYNDVELPFMEICERTRRLIFVEKLRRGIELPEMRKSPYIWALTTPTENDMEQYIDRKIAKGIIAEFRSKLNAFKAGGQCVLIINEVYEKYADELYKEEESLLAKLNALQDRVMAKLPIAGQKEP